MLKEKPFMATYLIDYENVKSEGIKGIAQLSEEDRVVIFYSHNADTITFEAMDMIFNSKAQVSKYKILCGGKNALDFQLSTYLGYLIHEAKDSYFYIISKDNGFKHVVDFWKRTFRFDGYVYCFATIADGNARQNRFKNATAKERARAMEEELAAMSEELEAQGDSDLEESEEDSAPETKEAVKEAVNEAVNEAEAVNDKESSEAEEMMQEEEPEETDEVAEQEIEEAPAEEEVQEEPTEEEPVQEESTEEPVQEEPAKELVQETEPIQEKSAEEPVQEKSAEKEPAEEPVHEPEQQKENKELENFASDTIIYPVQQHKPISVMPPAQLPDSVRKELEKADAQYKDSSEEDLQKKIAAAVSASTITVVESGMTIHHVEENKTKPVKKKAPAKTKKAPKQEEASENEVKPKKTRTAKTSKKKTEKEALAAEEKLEEKLAEEKPAKPARKPITRSTRAKKEAAPAEEKPVKEKTAKEKPAKEKLVQEKPAEEATEPKKPARRGRRPKAQSNIAASFE